MFKLCSFIIILHEVAEEGVLYAFVRLLLRSTTVFYTLLLSQEAKCLLLFDCEGKDLTHGLKHLDLNLLWALAVHKVDKKLIDNPSVYHELQSFIVFLDPFKELMRISLDLLSLGFTLV